MKETMLLLFISYFPFGLAGQVHVGVNGGGGLDNTVSLRASVPLEVTLSKSLSLQPALVFTQQHTPALLFHLSTMRDYRRATIGYVALPVMLKARFTLESFQLYVTVGPQLAYATALNATYLEDAILHAHRLRFAAVQVSRWDLSVVAGVGIEKKIHNDCKIRFELLQLLGLLDIDQRTDSAIYTEGRVFNLGFMIPIHNKAE